MINAIVILILILGIIFGIQSFLKRASGKSCCSSGDSEVKIEPADKNRSDYKFRAYVRIEGMTCKNCARRIENALNSIDGVWAKVNLRKKAADVLLKKYTTAEVITDAVEGAGYKAADIEIRK